MLWQLKASGDCVLTHCMDVRFGCYEAPQVRWSRGVSRSFVSNAGLTCAEGGLYHAVFCETWEEPLKRSLSNLVVDFSGSSCRIVWPCTRRTWLMPLTPRLSRRRANADTPKHVRAWLE